MRPNGPKFSDALEFWQESSVKEHFIRAANLVDGLHGMTISLSSNVLGQHVQCAGQQPRRNDKKEWPRCEGRIFFTESTGEPWLIYLNRDGLQPLLTASHEFGHLTHYAATVAAKSSVGIEQKLKVVVDWLKDSSPATRLTTLSETPDELDKLAAELAVVSVVKQLPPFHLDMSLRDYVTYLGTDDELFARGYAQWVAMSTNEPVINSQLDFWLEPFLHKRIPEQWQREEFTKGIDAFNALLLELGWMERP